LLALVLVLPDVCCVERYESISVNNELLIELSVLPMELMGCFLSEQVI